jgi:hypothetical protein
MIKNKDLNIVKRMVKGLLESDVADLLSIEARKEEVVTWTEAVKWEHTNDAGEVIEAGESVIQCKAKLDLLMDTPFRPKNMILDLKFVADATEQGFANAVHRWLYTVQDATYRKAAKVLLGRDADLTFIAVQDHPVQTIVAPHELSTEDQVFGEQMRQWLLADLARRTALNDWMPRCAKRVNTVRLKPWQRVLPCEAA